MTDVFLSYSSKDRERVRPIRDALVVRRYNLFWDQQVPVGENWDQWIRRHLSNAKVVVVFWTKNSTASLNVQHEAAIGREDGKLVPVVLEPMRAIDFPMGFYTMQAAVLLDWKRDIEHSGYLALLDAIKTRCECDAVGRNRLAQQDAAADVAELQRLSRLGNAGAQTQLGFRFRQGYGVDRNDEEAAKLFRLAGYQGSAHAQYALAIMMAGGKGGLIPNDLETVTLCRLAAEQGHQRALGQLGYWYERGSHGLNMDDAEAVRLYRLAAHAGNQWAEKRLLSRGLSQ
jgi:TIR domain/Sel1 repeat